MLYDGRQFSLHKIHQMRTHVFKQATQKLMQLD